MTTLLIDNYDSFTYNVYQSLCNLGANVIVHRNDEITLEQAIALNPRSLVISPGPGYPSVAGISNDLIRHYAGKIPILGVCLGEQCMYEIYGGKVGPCGELIHGKTTPVKHDGKGVFQGVPQDIECTRYHSLSGDPKTMPKELELTAWTDNGIVMGIRHKDYVMEGVQFHPESIASEQGDKIFANFLSWSGGLWKDLVIHPEWIKKQEDDEEVLEDLSHGIPLSLASKMNSTVKPAFQSKTKTNESILQKILLQRQKDVFDEKSQVGGSMEYLERSYALGLAPEVLSFKQRLLDSVTDHGVAVLAEVKRASPSKGDIDMLSHAPQQALLYAEGGAAAISVLTEPNWFKGSLQDLKDVRLALETHPNRPAVLRKEFIFDRYQILQARLAGADTVLLIVAILDDLTILNLIEYSRTLGMEPLVEVATVDEMKRALKLGSQIIGVNNRDLNTFTVDMNRTNTLSELLKQSQDIILLALSGISTRADVEVYLNSGAKGVLVGEALMKSPSKPNKVRELLGLQTVNEIMNKTKTLVKICGITNIADAKSSVQAGADILGFIFAKNSPRSVTAEQVLEIVKEIKGQVTKKQRDDTFIQKPESAATWFSSHELPSQKPLFVGVFTDHTVYEMNNIADDCGLDLIQCHTLKEPAFHRLLNRPSIQVLGIPTGERPIAALLQKAQSYVGSCSALLLDTITKEAVGGTGTTFDWTVAKEMKNQGIPVWLAGGLTPENVADAKKLGVTVVDVCSGVEQSKGKKDLSKLTKFMQNAQ